MAKHTILSLDLNKDVSSETRTKMYAAMAAQHYHKINPTTTLWYAGWKDSDTDAEIIAATKREILECANSAGVTAYDATVSVGTAPVSWRKA